MLWDAHTHTYFSGDSDAPPTSMIEAAREAGLLGICFTEHMDIDYQMDPELFLTDLSAYFAEIRPLVEKYAKDLTLCTGIELGLQPHLAPRLREIVSAWPFDFVLGSTHVVNGIDPYYPSFYENKTEQEAYEDYFKTALKNIAAFDDFDVYAHLDYVVRYGPNKNQLYSYEKYQAIIDEILTALISRGKGIEINTAGFKYGLGHPHPTEDILHRYRQLGGEIITIGSDAHKPKHIAYEFSRAAEILKDAGFKYYTVFKERTAAYLPLP